MKDLNFMRLAVVSLILFVFFFNINVVKALNIKDPNLEEVIVDIEDWTRVDVMDKPHLRFENLEGDITGENILFSTFDVTCIEEEEVFNEASDTVAGNEYPEVVEGYDDYILLENVRGYDSTYFLAAFKGDGINGYLSGAGEFNRKYNTDYEALEYQTIYFSGFDEAFYYNAFLLEEISELDVSGREISDLAGLEQAKKLQKLDLSSNIVEDISNMGQLDKLEVLDLSYNEVSDIAVLEDLENLRKLDIRENYLDTGVGSDDMEMIAGLKNEGVEVLYKPQKDAFDYEALEAAETDEERLECVDESYSALTEKEREDPELIGRALDYGERAIRESSTTDLKIEQGRADVSADELMENVEKTSHMEEQIKAKLEEYGIEKTRDLFTELNLEVEKEVDDLLINYSQDLAGFSQEIDYLRTDSGHAAFSISILNLEEEIEELEADNLEIELSVREGPVPGEVYAGTGGVFVDAIDIFSLDFGGTGHLENNIDLKLPISEQKEPEYTAVFYSDGEEDPEAIGGNVDEREGLIQASTGESGDYFVKENRQSFEDISHRDDFTQHAIEVLASKGIISGRGEDRFDPDASISRAEFAAIIMNVTYLMDNRATTDFEDVSKEDWYYTTVASSEQEGIVDGYPGNMFKPHSIINKQELVAVNASTLKRMKSYVYPEDIDRYLDFEDLEEIPGWVMESVALAEREGILVEREDNLFKGSNPLTRGDATVMLYRLFEKL